MSDDERDDEREEEQEAPEEGAEGREASEDGAEEQEAPGDGAEEAAPRPATWAGRKRAGAGEQADESGITEEFEGLEAELSAELGEGGPDGQDEAPDPADEEEEPPDEFEFEESQDSEAEEGDEPAPDAGEKTEPEPQAAEAEDKGAPEAAAEGGEAESKDADGGDEPDAAAAEEPASEATTVAAAGPTQETIETDTLAASDREAEQEAAHAGLRARAEKSAAERGTGTGAQAAVAEAVAGSPADGTGEPPKRTVWWRFLAASFVIVAATATATAVSFLLFLSDIAEGLRDPELGVARGELAKVEGQAPQTVLILGSDKRGGTPGDPGRSDTAMLLRVDPDKEFLALLSLPRDLKVEIPGYGTNKLNAAYSFGEQYEPPPKGAGGTGLAIKTIKDLLGIDINHVVNIDFEGFYDAVNAIDCVYVDIDRHYYNPEGGDYDAIDIKPGYTKLCGYIALDYVRYRHGDNDIVRGARQQDFIREARQRIPPRELLPWIGGGDELIDIFTKNTSSDVDDVETIIDMLKSFVDVRDAPVRQVELENTFEDSYVVSTQDQIDAAVDQFLGKDIDEEPVPAEEPEEEPPPEEKKKKKPDEPSGPDLIDASGTGQQYAAAFEKYLKHRKAHLPVFYPTQIVANVNTAITPESRAFSLAGPENKETYRGYKFVVAYQEPGFLSYYGVSGVNWTDPPILNNPSEIRRIDGRDYMLFWEADRLRLVGWKTDNGAYWVINTLTHALSEDEMLAVATSTREFDG